MQTPLVSVIVPVYNGARYLDCALNSILRQNYEPLEVIAVDDGSVDGSAEVIRAHAGVRYLHQPNQGVAVARNRGLSTAHGELIAFLDQDDWWTANKLRVQTAVLRDNPDAGYALARGRIHREPGIPPPPWLKPEIGLEREIDFLPGTWLVRRSVFDQIGGFNADFKIGLDTDWIVRTRRAGIASIVVPEVLLYWRIHERNQSYQQKLSRDEWFRLLRENIHHQRGAQTLRATE